MKNFSFLFDWDGCLVDSLHLWLESMDFAFTAQGAKLSDPHIMSGMQDWNDLTVHGISDIAKFGRDLYQHFETQLPHIELNQGAFELLHWLNSRQAQIAIVTSSPRIKLMPVLQRLNIESMFHSLITKDDVSLLKPNPEPLQMAMNHLNSNPESTYMIGDSLVDIQAGKAAGVNTIWYHPEQNHSYHSSHSAMKLEPDFKVDQLQQIRAIF